MSKLIMCRGLPGSGKSTWARNEELTATTTTVRVNKDDIRKSLGEPWSREQEKKVLDTRDYLITTALCEEKDVISDDTNFAPKHEQRLRALAKQYGARFVVKNFDTDVQECVRRDSLRPDGERVGEKVILEMYNQYSEPRFTEPRPVTRYVADSNLPSCVICDLDGTIAIHNGRSPYDYEKCDTDKLNTPVHMLLWAMTRSGVQVVYLSGRDDIVYGKTLTWLRAKMCPDGPLFMRKTGDKRKDCVMKAELFDAEIRGKYNVLFCLDDRDQVVKLWRDMGLTCLQVNYGNF